MGGRGRGTIQGATTIQTAASLGLRENPKGLRDILGTGEMRPVEEWSDQEWADYISEARAELGDHPNKLNLTTNSPEDITKEVNVYQYKYSTKLKQSRRLAYATIESARIYHGLNEEQRHAIGRYINSGVGNAQLIQGLKGTDAQMRFASTLDGVLNRVITRNPQILFRGVQHQSMHDDAIAGRIKPGDILRSGGFTSTTLDVLTARYFAGWYPVGGGKFQNIKNGKVTNMKPQDGVFYRIKVPAGVRGIAPILGHPLDIGEAESVMNMGIPMRVIKVHGTRRIPIIDVEVAKDLM